MASILMKKAKRDGRRNSEMSSKDQSALMRNEFGQRKTHFGAERSVCGHWPRKVVILSDRPFARKINGAKSHRDNEEEITALTVQQFIILFPLPRAFLCSCCLPFRFCFSFRRSVAVCNIFQLYFASCYFSFGTIYTVCGQTNVHVLDEMQKQTENQMGKAALVRRRR